MTPSCAPRFSAPNQALAAAQSAKSATASVDRASAEARQSADTSTALDEKLAKASEFLKANKPREALELLSPLAHDAEAQDHFGFQARLGSAYMGVVDHLVAANQLGGFLVAPDTSGNWLKPTIHAERVSCYLGVLGAFGRLMQILQQPDQRERFITKNSQEKLKIVEDGVRSGIAHAMFESELFLTRISQINSNQASQSFVKRCLETGQFTEDHYLVRSFREVEVDPLYQPIFAATSPIQQAAVDDGQVPQNFWREWLQKENQKLLQLPAYQLARPYADKTAELSQLIGRLAMPKSSS